MAGPRPGHQGIQPGYRQGLLGAGYAACLRESLRPKTSLRPHRPPPRRCRLLLRRPHPRRRRTRLARRTQPRSHVRRRLALAVQQPQRLPLSLLCAGRTPFAPGAGAPTVRRWDWFCCRSTAPVRTGRARCEPGGVGFWFWAKVSRSCADFLSCSPVFGVPCLFRLPLVLLLGAALPAQAMTFQTRMEDVQWSVEGDKFECRLSQRVDGYGEAVFIRRAGERPMFQLSAWSELMRPGAAQLYNDPPPWRPDARVQPLGQGTVQSGTTVMRLPWQQAGQMLAGLSRGLQPTILQGSLSDAGQQVRVVVSSVGYPQAWKDFQACADGLLPMNLDQISRTAIGFPSGGAVLDARARQMLDVALEYIKADPQVSRIELDGHSDNVGDRLSNRDLSRQRVLAVQAYLVERGVDEDMISIRFHGERYPVANNNTREGREKNRRVTLRLERS